MAKEIISIKNFSKHFGALKAVDNLTFSVEPGEVFAFLGANGSGKTTTIRSLLGIYQPTTGSLLIDGQPYTPAMAPMIGYLPEERGLYADSQTLEILVYFGQLKGMDKVEATAKATDYLDKVGLADKANLKIKKLSAGQQQKIQLGLATINEPELMVLDEPTKGLDPINRSLLVERLEELRAKGSTILYTTHQLEEIEHLGTDKVLIIKDGRLAAMDSPAKLKRKYKAKTLDDVFLKVYKS